MNVKTFFDTVQAYIPNFRTVMSLERHRSIIKKWQQHVSDIPTIIELLSPNLKVSFEAHRSKPPKFLRLQRGPPAAPAAGLRVCFQVVSLLCTGTAVRVAHKGGGVA